MCPEFDHHSHVYQLRVQLVGQVVVPAMVLVVVVIWRGCCAVQQRFEVAKAVASTVRAAPSVTVQHQS
jgi:hypothetical protein